MQHPRILVIEDNSLLRWYMIQSLTREGFLVIAPPNVDESLRLATQYPFDVLISDWRLPDGRTGLEVLTVVRQVFPKTPCILISAEADAEFTQKALMAGFNRVIQKPAEISEVVGAIQSL